MTPADFRSRVMALPQADRDAVLDAACRLRATSGAANSIEVIAVGMLAGIEDMDSAGDEACAVAFAALMAAEAPALPVESIAEATGANRERLRAVLVAVSDGPSTLIDCAIWRASITPGYDDWTSTDPHIVLGAATVALSGDVADWQVEAARKAARDLGVEAPQ